MTEKQPPTPSEIRAYRAENPKLRERDVVLGPGELFVVPRGVEHCPRADDEAHVLLIEHVGTPNTGDSAERAAAVEEEI